MNEAAEHGLVGPLDGICVDNQDPEGLQRIRVYIPHFTDDAGSDWAWPKERGGGRWDVPRTSADWKALGQDRPGDPISVTFAAGDPDALQWERGHGAKVTGPGGTATTEIPTPCVGLAPADYTKLLVLADTPTYSVYIDERPATAGFYVIHKKTGDVLQHDGKRQGWMLWSTLTTVIGSTGLVWIKSTIARIFSRVVDPTTDKVI